MSITDAQIREALAGLVATVEAEHQLLLESNMVLSHDSCEVTFDFDDDSAATLAAWNAQIAAGKAAIEELDRRAAELAQLRARGGALA